MNKKILISTLIVLTILLAMPLTNALEQPYIIRPFNNTYKDLDLEQIIEQLIQELNDNTMLITQLQTILFILKTNPQLKEHLNDQNPDETENQPIQRVSIRQRIWDLVLKYRLYRLMNSINLYLLLNSNFMALRVLKWSIKVIRWIRVGIIIKVVDATYQEPLITFTPDYQNNTLNVTYVFPKDLTWSDIEEIGEGTTAPLPTNKTVEIGDTITNCAGIIILRYKPTDKILGIWEFDQQTIPSIHFIKNDIENKLTVASCDPADVTWSELKITPSNGLTWKELQPVGFEFNSTTDFIEAGDYIQINNTKSGTITIHNKPTNTLIGSWNFT